MVDFKKRLAGRKTPKPTDPIELYDTLDRAHDKGPLRPAQTAVLKEWHHRDQSTRDTVVKLHTGQGKTLIGLLILQSRLNANQSPVVYLCPNNFLISQACEQARQFGISTCVADSELPDEFLNGHKILVTSAQKLFNGLTKFGLGAQSVPVNTILMDDAHACVDIIRNACRIRLSTDQPAYQEIRALFGDDLEAQGAGTWADICNGHRQALLPVPYWAWTPKEADVARVLSKNADHQSVKFVWPLLKDMLSHCQCIVSGSVIEIEPYVAPLDMFGSYWNSKRRVFMSATVTNDAFLIKGLRLAPETITQPLGYDEETWAGERMLLLPSLIHEDLSRASIVKKFAVPKPKRTSGVVALAPSVSRTQDWKKYGATVADKGSVADTIKQLKAGAFENTVVLVNRYDGIDLPDDACRVLIFDSRPYTESLPDLYQELCRPNSDATLMRIVRTIEQGMGRSVRGEKDYCVVIATGTDLVRILRDRATREYFSPQMNAQIDLGFEIAELAKQDIDADKEPFAAFVELISQCVHRDGGWKEFYISRMNKIAVDRQEGHVLQSYVAELAAATAYTAGDYEDATNTIQAFLDKSSVEADDRGWYLQEMARYNWRGNRAESERLQKAAHKSNRKLLRLPTMAAVTKLTTISQKRIEHIGEWVKDRGDYSGLEASASDILSDLTFSTKANRFERALNELGRALGFDGEQPDRDWKAGPDNLWALNDEWYLLWECKSEVSVTRAHIDKREAEQMNRSSAWFERYYSGARVKRLIVHPTHKVHRSAAFTHEVEVMRVAELQKLTKAVREFFKNFERLDFRSLSTRHIQTLVDSHGLGVDSLLSKYSKKLRLLARDPAS